MDKHYLSDTALGLDTWERNGLIALVPFLEGMNYNRFDMETSCSLDEECGTVACIGGWLWLRRHVKDLTSLTDDEVDGARDYVTSTGNYYSSQSPRRKVFNLFYPPDNLDWEGVTPKVAAEAIENFLTTGEPRWEELLWENP